MDAVAFTMYEGADLVGNKAADVVINNVNAAFGSTGGQPVSSRSFSEDLGVILGKALGAAPFKLLDELFDDE